MRNTVTVISNASCRHSGLDPESRNFSRKLLDSCFRRNDEQSGLNPQSAIHNPNSRGVSIIAAIFIIVILAFMGLMFVSLISTGSFSAINDMQSAQALYIAEGGIEFTLAKNAFPNYVVSTTNLGTGSFNVAAPSSLDGELSATSTTPIIVNATPSAIFPTSNGRIVIDSEVIAYGTWNGSTTFSTITRGVDGTTMTAHADDSAVYPVTSVSVDPGTTPITVSSTAGFVIPGIINIDSENIYCTGTNATQFTNCTRAYGGTTAAVHAAGSHVFQYVFSSAGTVNSARRVVRADLTSRITHTTMALKLAGNGRDWVIGAEVLRPAGTIVADNNPDAHIGVNSGPYQWPHTVSAGANRILIVGVCVGGNTAVTGVSATYGIQPPVPLTLVASQNHPSGSVRVEIWHLINPPGGTCTVTVTAPGNPSIVAGSVSFTGVDQANPMDAPPVFTSGTTPAAQTWISDSVITFSNNAVTVAFEAFKPTAISETGPGETQLWSDTAGAAVKGAVSMKPSGGGAGAGAGTIFWQEVFR